MARRGVRRITGTLAGVEQDLRRHLGRVSAADRDGPHRCRGIRASRLGLCAGSVDGLVEFADRENLDPADEATCEDYAEHAAALAPKCAWPPGRNEPCWCGSARKYKKCCFPRARS
ncbi:hypothetical protein FXW78_51060 [Rhodococcus opacus]|nr:hypothetical protein [Rhodococcus opacus]